MRENVAGRWVEGRGRREEGERGGRRKNGGGKITDEEGKGGGGGTQNSTSLCTVLGSVCVFSIIRPYQALNHDLLIEFVVFPYR